MDGASVYGYGLQSPNRYTDFRGLFTFQDAVSSLYGKNRSKYYDSGFTQEEIFNEWLDLERNNADWLDELPACPCNVEDAIGEGWNNLAPANPLHLGGVSETQSKPTAGGHASQCVYDANGNLMTEAPAGGTADFKAFTFPGVGHTFHDVLPFFTAQQLGRVNDYYSVRPVQ